MASVASPHLDSNDYSIGQTPKSWKQININTKDEIVLALQSESEKSSLTIREFKSTDPSLKKNAVKWLQDYKSYGFKILSSKPVKLNDETYGYLIQALHKKSKKVFRQYMSIKNKKLVVLTCHSDRLDNEFKACSESLTSFSWKTNL